MNKFTICHKVFPNPSWPHPLLSTHIRSSGAIKTDLHLRVDSSFRELLFFQTKEEQMQVQTLLEPLKLNADW